MTSNGHDIEQCFVYGKLVQDTMYVYIGLVMFFSTKHANRSCLLSYKIQNNKIRQWEVANYQNKLIDEAQPI